MTELRLAPDHLTELLTIFEHAETAAAWLVQETEALLCQAPDAMDHPQYLLWRVASSVADGLAGLREELGADDRQRPDGKP